MEDGDAELEEDIVRKSRGQGEREKAEERLYSYCCWTVRRVLRKEWACLMGKVRPEAKREKRCRVQERAE